MLRVIGKTVITSPSNTFTIIDKNVPNIDPEVTVSSGNVQGLEGGALLPTRTIGINLSFGF